MPADPSKLAKAIIDEATSSQETSEEHEERLAAEELSRKKSESGKAGGKARAEVLSEDQRREIAKTAAKARWKKSET